MSMATLGCDFFERRSEKRIDVGTLLAFLFLFQMASYVFVLFCVCFFGVGPSASMRVCIWTHRYFSHVIILPDAASSVV